jgi:ribosomal-protein-serine acetyltransferase
MRTNDMSIDKVNPYVSEPALTDGRICLRPWKEKDADDLHAAVHESLVNVGRWLPWCHKGYGPADAAAWIAHCQTGWRTGEHYAFAIIDALTGQLLGGTELNQFNRLHRIASLGYWVRQSRQRQGAAAAAATLTARFGFKQLKLIRIEIIVMPGNHASRCTAGKIGARFEAVARQRLWASGQAHDAAVYGLIAEDLPQTDEEQSFTASS